MAIQYMYLVTLAAGEMEEVVEEEDVQTAVEVQSVTEIQCVVQLGGRNGGKVRGDE